MQLSNTAKNIEIYYDILNVKFPDKIHLKYRLKDHLEWKDITQKDKLNLSYLDPGTYEIQFLVQDEDSGLVSVNTLLKITINPPFYLTLPFLIVFFMFLMVCVGIYNKVRLKRIKKNQGIETKQLIYEKQLSDVKLQALRSEMNSHFLFNILASIQYFILKQDVDQGLYYLDRFSSLIRMTLEFSDKKSVSLYEELAYLEKYVKIENLRKHVKVKFSYNVVSDISLTQVYIIPLLLQPFVENSMLHSFTSSIKNPEIVIEIQSLINEIKIVIIGNGVGYQKINKHKHHSKCVSIL